MVLLLAFVVVGPGVAGPFGSRPANTSAAQAAGNTDQVLVKFKTNASQMAIDALNASTAVQQVDAIPALGIRVLRVPFGWTAEQMAQRYSSNPLVEFAEVNALVEPELVPNDPNYGSAWHLPKIDAPGAWDRAKAIGVLIAICDTGVASVPDLAPVLRGDLGWNAADGSSNYSDQYGHGTKVAGTAGAATNNGIGVAGVAWGAQVMPVRITNSTNGSAYVSNGAKCITYASDKGARVINLSYRMAGYATIDSAGKYAQGKGAVTVVAAGNDGTDPGWTSFSGFLAVAGTDQLDKKASWSNFGSFVDLAAPGVSIMTTRMDGSYGTSSGTSFSSPVTAGVLALIFAANPNLTAAQAESILLSSADDLGPAGWDASFGHGRVNAEAALQAALGDTGSDPEPSPTPTPTPAPNATATPTVAGPTATPTATPDAPTPAPTATSTPSPPPGDQEPPAITLTSPAANVYAKGNVAVGASASDNVGVARVLFYVDGALLGSDWSAPYSVRWNASKAGKGTHTILGVAYDAASNSASDTLTVTVQ
jgi:subtilisin family serine protease